MSREILFKAKRLDNGEWVEGYLSYNNARSQYYIMDDVNAFPIPVREETVCEYIGIHDKNGTKIFENDIVRTQERYNRPYSKSRKSKRHIGVVEYQIGKGSGFYNRETGKHDRYMESAAEWIVRVKDYGVYVHGSWGDFWDCEVIGNVFENSELWEG